MAADLGVTPGLVSHYFSAAEQLITAAFRSAAVADLEVARSRVDAAPTAVAKMDALMDYVLDDSSDDASALWLEAWSLGRRNAPLAAEAKELTADWLDCIAEIVRAGVADGEFHVADVDVAARRLLTMIDGLGARRSCARCRRMRPSTSRRPTSLPSSAWRTRSPTALVDVNSAASFGLIFRIGFTLGGRVSTSQHTLRMAEPFIGSEAIASGRLMPFFTLQPVRIYALKGRCIARILKKISEICHSV